MQRVVLRDKAAFQVLLERHAPRMLSLACHTLRDTAQAQDVAEVVRAGVVEGDMGALVKRRRRP